MTLEKPYYFPCRIYDFFYNYFQNLCEYEPPKNVFLFSLLVNVNNLELIYIIFFFHKHSSMPIFKIIKWI